MENQAKVENEISFIRFSGKCNKYGKRYFSYIRTDKNYWLSVDVTKSSPFKKIRTLPPEGLIPSVVVYICLVATSKKGQNKKKGNNKEKKQFRRLFKRQN